MAPTGNRKRAARPASAGGRSSSSASTKRQATQAAAGKACPKNKGRKAQASTVAKLSSHGFSSTQRPQFPIGSKLLLDDSIYQDKVPSEVEGCLFVYQIVKYIGDDVEIQYKNQVIDDEGDQFRVYEDSEDAQVCLSIL
jgi:hypothetical protein